MPSICCGHDFFFRVFNEYKNIRQISFTADYDQIYRLMSFLGLHIFVYTS